MARSKTATVAPARKPKKQYKLLFMVLPFMVIVLLFNYVPIFGWIYSVFDYVPGVPILECDFMGLDYFKMIMKDANVIRALKNTFIFAGISIILTPLPMIFAILLNELRGKVFKSAVQTISYIPHFLSVVVICSMLNGFGSTSGLFNDIRNLLGMARVDMNNGSQYFLPLYLGSQVWQTVGWSSIMYLSALSNVDVTLYDVANIDGANRWQKIKNIIWPTIKPTTTILLIMNLGNVLNSDYTKILLMQNDTNRSQLEVIGTFVYQKGIVEGKFSYATAVNLFISVIGFALVFGANMITRKINPENSLW